MKTVLKYAATILAAAIVYTFGLVPGDMLPTVLGLPAPATPEGLVLESILLATFLASLGLAAVVAWLARGLPGRFLQRWLLLALFVAGGHTAMFIEAGIFMDTGADAVGVTLFNILVYLVPNTLIAAAIAWLVPNAEAEAAPFRAPAPAWLWRVFVALLAYPIIYVVFGLLVVPYIYDFYVEGAYGLAAPTWGQIIPVQLLRSALLLAVILPLIVRWRLSRGQLFLRLGLAVYFLIGLQWTLAGFWMDPALRLVHSLEVLADATLYTAVLVLLFTGQEVSKSRQTRSERQLSGRAPRLWATHDKS